MSDRFPPLRVAFWARTLWMVTIVAILGATAMTIATTIVTVMLGALPDSSSGIQIYNDVGAADVVVDVTGYYTSTPVTGGRFTTYASSPSQRRAFDTRNGQGGIPTNPVGPLGHLDFTI